MEPLQQAENIYQRLDAALLTPLVTLLTLGAFIYFLYGVVRFFIAKDSDGKGGRRKLEGTGADAVDSNPMTLGDAKAHLFWGIVGLVVIFGANIILSTLRNTVEFFK